ncbi:hypothetical protein [Rubinisphaera brasiliensis]|uniref:Uncharacterized protein n=1 Tax=Rubinisphaera brasiliensis (strain ATCC 49424 / DSM 5305 / JCM 21570 / IAM 15109 / NBRC 103401 / IFAM 1448) TaxID=756272 RepID=F0SH09_RUBBR|nr:hypothetical protein [Rubinisphaera brasiliensis]ADY59494.1 hypothetical protein Plabr_1885 [Rubinisphaera brasiliensis DSM 5305]
MKLFFTIVCVIFSPTAGIFGQETSQQLNRGDFILLELTGPSTSDFVKATGEESPQQDFGVLLECQVVSIQEDIATANCYTKRGSNTNSPKLVSVSVQFATSSVVHGGPIPLEIADHLAENVRDAVQRQMSLPRVYKDNYDGVSIQEWSLTNSHKE